MPSMTIKTKLLLDLAGESIMTKFRDAQLQRIYADCLTYHPKTGGLGCAFRLGLSGRESRYLRTSMAYAAFCAGRDLRKKERATCP